MTRLLTWIGIASVVVAAVGGLLNEIVKAIEPGLTLFEMIGGFIPFARLDCDSHVAQLTLQEFQECISR